MRVLNVLLSSTAIGATLTLAAPSSHQKQVPLVAVAVPSSDALDPFSAEFEAKKLQGFRLIKTSEAEPPSWCHFGQILELYQENIKFIDVTDQDLESVASLAPPKRYDIPDKPRHAKVVEPFLANISTGDMEAWLTKFTSFKTRYYQSETGKQSAEWLHTQVLTVAGAADRSRLRLRVSQFEHDWPQPSILVRIEDAEMEAATAEELPAVIVSAHQDSTNQWNPWWGAAPGADDDGSGSATIFEAYRVLVSGGFRPIRPIEFHWYAAEEGGLLGSQKVVADYKRRGVPVSGVFHADMTGYTPKDKVEVIGIATDNVDEDLEEFVRELVTVYNPTTKIIDTSCGYGCSDHASWTKGGFPAAFTFETDFKSSSPYIHSVNDVVENIDFNHMAKFTRLAIAFAVELSYTE
ncbi:hypothetical protein BC830DRAFT_1114790 [Chytriomyces sp. MP71]|nr:hypothetical protein BC830DRAFT_1114790 [Chytriomyces sp. MP71]